MTEQTTLLLIPEEFRSEADEIVEVLHSAAQRSSVADLEEIRLLKPVSRTLLPDKAADLFITLGTSAAVWLTTKWLDEYVWPVVSRRLEKKAERIMKWLKDEAKHRNEDG